jgi:hypothetical protein
VFLFCVPKSGIRQHPLFGLDGTKRTVAQFAPSAKIPNSFPGTRKL